MLCPWLRRVFPHVSDKVNIWDAKGTVPGTPVSLDTAGQLRPALDHDWPATKVHLVSLTCPFGKIFFLSIWSCMYVFLKIVSRCLGSNWLLPEWVKPPSVLMEGYGHVLLPSRTVSSLQSEVKSYLCDFHSPWEDSAGCFVSEWLRREEWWWEEQGNRNVSKLPQGSRSQSPRVHRKVWITYPRRGCFPHPPQVYKPQVV